MQTTKGFSLLELIIAVAIISLITLVVAPNVLGALDRGKRSSTQSDMRALATALERYAADEGSYPAVATLSELRALLVPSFIKSLPLDDGWGHPLIYEVGAGGDTYSLRSPGKDGVFLDSPEQSEFNTDLIMVDGAFVEIGLPPASAVVEVGDTEAAESGPIAE